MRGRVRGARTLAVELDGREVAGELLEGVGTAFRFSVVIPAGEHTLEVVADSDAGSERISRRVRGPAEPNLPLRVTVLSPRDGAWLAVTPAEVRGQLVPPRAGEVDVAGATHEVGEDGVFVVRVPLEPGPNVIPIRVTGVEGAPETTLTLNYDETPPRLELEDPPAGLQTPASRVLFRGRVQQATALAINGQAVPLTRGEFDVALPLELGENLFELVLSDPEQGGSELKVVRVVTRIPDDVEPPPWMPEGIEDLHHGTFKNVKDGSELVYVPATAFDMGRNHTEDQAPRRRVRITHALFVGKYEVTWGQYRAFCAATGRAEPPTSLTLDPAGRFVPSDQHPVYNVSWNDAHAYATWAGLRLLTEAEWEAVAGGSRNYTYPWGPELPPLGVSVANVAPELTGWSAVRDDGYPFPTPVGTFPKGASLPYGLLDMAGNVHEWVSDRYARGYDPQDTRNPQGPSEGGLRVFRGGSWQDRLAKCDVLTRRAAEPGYAHDHLGFRVCVSGR
ncbi:MAG: SUMF1/EgtB/PvdO family nonheme iron enzyme [Planctomycetota bacterium]